MLQRGLNGGISRANAHGWFDNVRIVVTATEKTAQLH